MKIAMFADCWHPVINGVVTSIDILRTRLRAIGHEVELYVPAARPGQKDGDPSVHRFLSVTAPFHRESRFSLPAPLAHMSHLYRNRPDLVHIHTPFNLGLLGQFVAARLDVPFVFTHHTLWEEYVHYVPLVSKRILRRTAIDMVRLFCSRSDGVIAPSAEVRDRLREQGVTQRIEVIPTGIDMELFLQGQPERVRADLGIAPDEPVAIYAGRMGKEKSLDLVLEAFARVLQTVPTARLLMLGGGPEKSALEEQARTLGIASRVTFTGYVKRERMVDYLKAARVFLFASVTETQGLVSLEAQAAGCPVVAVRASGSSEAVADGESGFLVDPDREVLAARAARLLTDEALHRTMSAQAVKHAWTFSSQTMAERTLALYRDAIEAHRGPVAAAAGGRARG